MSKELAKITGITAKLGKTGLLGPEAYLTGKLLQDKSPLLNPKPDPVVPVAAKSPTESMPMPDSDGEAVNAARRRRLAAIAQRGGRQSTILSQGETLGGT